MYKVNDTVAYGTRGVCEIVDITEKLFMGMKKEYYVLKPIDNTSTTLFVPTDNEAITSKLRKILSKDEIHKLIASVDFKESVWIEDKNERKEKYRKIIESGDHRLLIQMIKTLWEHIKERQAEGKKALASDERFFKEAELLLYNEFQYVLKISKEELVSYIFCLNAK